MIKPILSFVLVMIQLIQVIKLYRSCFDLNQYHVPETDFGITWCWKEKIKSTLASFQTLRQIEGHM